MKLMRITSGTAKGHTIRMPAGPEIRPTLDMTRKAVFDILGGAVEGCRFLDLFAGTGANGIEALSRGAESAVFVDKSRFSIEAVRRNLAKTRLEEKAKLIKADVFNLFKKTRFDGVFDIVFADPPYQEQADANDSKISIAEKVLTSISTGGILADCAYAVIEHSYHTDMPESEGVLELWKARRYGSAGISIYRTKS